MSDTVRGDAPNTVRGDPRLDDLPVAELLKRLSEQTSTLVRQELDLAKAELTVKGKRLGAGAGMFGGAGLFGVYAFGALTACIILVLSLAVAGWLAALIVTVVYAAIAGVLALTGKKQVQEATPPVPEQTVDSVKEDVQWTKQRAKAGRQ
jgi:putative superfamily III holin-X